MSDLSPNARSFIESARRAHVPTADDRARIREALSARLAAPVAAASQGAFAAPKALAAKLTVAKMLAGAVFVGAVGAASVWVSARPAPRGSAADHPLSRISAASVANTRSAHVGSTSEAPSPLPSIPNTPSFAAIDPPPALSVPPIEPVPEGTQPAASSRSRPSPHARTVARVETAIAPIEVSAPVTPPPLAPSPTNTLREELLLVRAAQDAARNHDPAHALALLDEHATRFPHGLLREERSAARVLALCALDRPGEARIEAAALLREAPNSPHASRVRASCVGSDDSSAEP